MTIQEAKNKIKEARGSWKIFNEWMIGQTMSLDENGETNIYDYDVERFIKMNCNPNNENSAEFD